MCLCVDDEPEWKENEPEPRNRIIGTARRIWPNSPVWTQEELKDKSATIWKLLAAYGIERGFAISTLRTEFCPQNE